MRRYINIILFLLCGCTIAKPVSTVKTYVVHTTFRTEKEMGVFNYVLQYSSDIETWTNEYKVDSKGSGDYSIYTPYKAGYYRLEINEEVDTVYTNILKLN